MYEPPPHESAGICPHCGKPMVKHILKEGARYHVISWYRGKNGAFSHCSEPDCEENHGLEAMLARLGRADAGSIPARDI